MTIAGAVTFTSVADCPPFEGFTVGSNGNKDITINDCTGLVISGIDHIIPRSVCPELDNTLYNLEMMPLTLNQRKSANIGQRQIDLARRWRQS